MPRKRHGYQDRGTAQSVNAKKLSERFVDAKIVKYGPNGEHERPFCKTIGLFVLWTSTQNLHIAPTDEERKLWERPDP